MKNKKNTGVTFIEILIVVAIIGVISSIVFINLSQFRNEQVLKNTAVDIVSLLNKARSNTLSSLNSTNYSVHFEQGQVVLFVGPIYSASNVTNEPMVFSTAVMIVIPSGINLGGGADVTYKRLTGDTIGGTITIQLVSDAVKQKTITISPTGVASVN